MDKNNAKKLSLLSLALPILVEQILRSLMGTVNTFMLSRISDNASAAVGVANQILNIVTISSMMISSGAAVVINQHLGAGHDRESSHIMMNSITFSALVGLVFSMAVLALATPLVTLMGLEAQLIEDAAIYLRIVGASCLMQFISTMISTLFRCKGRANIPMMVIVFNNAVNLIGSLLVVQGILPIHGVAGIASVRLCSETLGLALIIFVLTRQKWGLALRDLVRIDFKCIKQIASLGFMSGLEGISYNGAQLVTTSFITALPATVLSAKVYTQTVNNYAYVAGMAIGQAAQIIAGHMIGAGRAEDAHRFIRKSWLYVLGCNVIFSLLFYSFAKDIVGLFTQSEEIISIAKMLFFIDIITCMGRSMNHSFNYGLRAAGYVFWPMIIAAASIWTIQVGLGYVLTIPAGFGIVGLWIGQATDEWVRGLLTMYLWLKKKWAKTAVIKTNA